MPSLRYEGTALVDSNGIPSLLLENATYFGQKFDAWDLSLLLSQYKDRRITIQIDVEATGEPCSP